LVGCSLDLQKQKIKNDDYLDGLVDLGLTSLQAKVYLNLARLVKADIKGISRVSGVARTDLYRIMPELERLGLVEKKVSKPVVYQATAMADALSILFKKKKNEYEQTGKKTYSLIEYSKTHWCGFVTHDNFDNQEFTILSEVEVLKKRWKELILKSKKCAFACPNNGLKFLLYYFYHDMNKALRNGTEIHIITEHNIFKKRETCLIKNLAKNPTFKIRFFNTVTFALAIFDDEASINISQYDTACPSLYSSNHKFIKSISLFFKAIWKYAYTDDSIQSEKILDIPLLQSTLTHFYTLTKIGFAFIDLKGNILISTGWQDICRNFHRVNPQTSKNCLESDILLTCGIKKGEIRIYKCKNNLWVSVTPFFIGDKHVGNIFFGQFFVEDEPVDLDIFAAQAEKYGFKKEEYLQALSRVPRISREKVNEIMIFYQSLFASVVAS
jgi:sugar-specific transcriptional regulator TrmB/ligand-binding sensor protein